MKFLKSLFGRGAPTASGDLRSEPVLTPPSAGWRDTEIGKLILQIDADRHVGIHELYNYQPPSTSETFVQFKAERGVVGLTEMARFLFVYRHQIMNPVFENRAWDVNSYPGFGLFAHLMRSSLEVSAEELLTWLKAMKADSKPKPWKQKKQFNSQNIHLQSWPIGHLTQLVQRKTKKQPLTAEGLALLSEICMWDNWGYHDAPMKKAGARLKAILAEHTAGDGAWARYEQLPGDQFGDKLQTQLDALDDGMQERWHSLFALAATANQARPTKSFTTQADALKRAYGSDWVRDRLHDWLGLACQEKIRTGQDSYGLGANRTTFTYHLFWTDDNAILLKGLTWLSLGYDDPVTINTVADLAEHAMTAIPGTGPAAPAVMNAGLLYLDQTPGPETIARLSRMKSSIKQKNVQKRVAEIFNAKAEKSGQTAQQLAERSVPTFNLTAGDKSGAKSVSFEDFALEVAVDGLGKISTSWIKPDGSAQKTKPKFIAEDPALKKQFDSVKTDLAAMKKALSAQRNRIDLLFAEALTWPLTDIQTHYIDQPLIGGMARSLIWEVDGTAALFIDGAWQDVTGAPVIPTDQSTATLWHPVEQATDTVLAWRARLERLGIIQPWKQAHREVYHLTDAERVTGNYSNRMAAHMVKQHQAATLLRGRGWSYQLMGAYDNGLDDQFASRSFTTNSLRAEYLFHTLHAGDHFNDAGIYLYVGTDQLRFRSSTDTPVALEDVAPRLLSEVMREADLVVGVASVGNDPAWYDQGTTPEARDYWQDYAFGELDAFAKTRRGILERLIPRLKIRDVARVDGRYLHVQGKLNDYRIHLGSSNIMMDPGDRYLCIVPGAVTKSNSINLPFEGDNRLSVILSKALMLAEDDKITASDIVRQLSRYRA